MPKLAVFPKAYMDDLCVDGTMLVKDWLDIAGELDVDGVEWYSGFIENKDSSNWRVFRSMAEDRGLEIPMVCCSPDFTHPDPGFRAQQVLYEKNFINMSSELGAKYCRVLSGQRRPEVSLEEGLNYASECIIECVQYAQERGIELVLENHYKDDFWEYPEFAQFIDVFCELVDRIDLPGFGVNYDPSNAYLAGDDPIELLKRISHRVITMHASDRYLIEGTIDDLRNQELGSIGYAKMLKHGQIGEGLNDYDAIFSELRRVSFDGWISIEDGVDGVEQLKNSVEFLKNKISEYF
ncbi:MAG: sugar phosphate isomerase/epimerase family protein [Verrucomicrobiota bacterium]|nr:myo-inositol catabolism protein IolH [Verrucomicrobiales bacterium]MEC9042592.1 sugar phosphate isomerase/epimerase family protein [Verrucomicrobiota bacterium]MEC9111162.1 sugar phosphate isomerase/epimerase family protein [Verrucomicrobiota bacterium]MEE2724120.1 sugar phosphate isomerase/epimerase family protein [Verrucomicrobiota bacterium]|tara:strand:- start:1297 stop:2178 length:882 start_codon:yes stop_codon:yes gene_type:complete